MPRGHAVRAHTADAIIEAWGPTAAACYEEAVAAFVALFAAAHDGSPAVAVGLDLGPGTPEELLVLLLEEVLLDADALGRVPTGCRLEVAGDHLRGELAVVPAEGVEPVGPVPKGVAWHGLAFGREGDGWRCRATVDV